MREHKTRSLLNPEIQYKWQDLNCFDQLRIMNPINTIGAPLEGYNEANAHMAFDIWTQALNFWRNSSLEEKNALLLDLFRSSKLTINNGESEQHVDVLEMFPTIATALEAAKFILAEAVSFMWHKPELKKNILAIKMSE